MGFQTPTSRLFGPKPFQPLGFVWNEKGQVHLRSSDLLATPNFPTLNTGPGAALWLLQPASLSLHIGWPAHWVATTWAQRLPWPYFVSALWTLLFMLLAQEVCPNSLPHGTIGIGLQCW